MKRSLWGRIMASAALTFTVVLASAGSVAAGKKSLRVSADPGMKLQYRIEAQNETHFSGITITENQGGDVEMEALEMDADKNPRFAFSFANFEASIMQGGNLTERDPQLNGIVVHVTMSPRGEQVELTPQSNLPQQQRELVTSLIDAFFAYLPEDEVDRDDSWVHKRLEESKTDDNVPSVDGEMEYLLEEFDKKAGHDCAKLMVEGAVALHTPTPAGMFAGKAKTEGEMYVTVGGGHIVKSKLTTVITGNVGENEVSRVQDLEIKLRDD